MQICVSFAPVPEIVAFGAGGLVPSRSVGCAAVTLCVQLSVVLTLVLEAGVLQSAAFCSGGLPVDGCVGGNSWAPCVGSGVLGGVRVIGGR